MRHDPIDRILHPDERILWAGRPSGLLIAAAVSRAPIAGALGLAYLPAAAIVASGLGVGLIDPTVVELSRLLAIGGLLAPLLLAALLVARRRVELAHERYAITDRRSLIADERSGAVASVPHGEDWERGPSRSLLFEQAEHTVVLADGRTRRRCGDVGIVGAEEVDEAARVLQRCYAPDRAGGGELLERLRTRVAAARLRARARDREQAAQQARLDALLGV